MKRFIILFFLAGLINYGHAQKTLTIGIIDEQRNAQSDVYLEQLKSNITAVVGKQTIVVFNEVQYNNLSISKAKENYRKLLQNKTDIVISFGVVNTIMLHQEKTYSTPTIVVGAINNDFVDIPHDELNSGINNLTYLITPFSYQDDLDAFQSILNYKKIGIVVDEYLLKLLPIEKLFDQHFAKSEQDYQLIPINKQSNIDLLFSDIDAVYLASYNSLSADAFSQLVQIINEKQLPSLSGYGVKDVEKGILASNQPAINFDQIFRRIALNVEAITNGTNASELPLHINYKKQLSINMHTANEIDFAIKNSMLAKVNLIEGKGASQLTNRYSMLDLMNGVVNANLALEAERQNIKLSEQDVKGSKSQYLPDLTANANGAYLDPNVAEISNGQNPEFTTAGNVNLNQVIYSEQASANISIQKNLLASQKETYNASELDALLNASIAYYNTLILKTNLSIQNKNLQMTKQNLDIANQNLELGASGKSDVLRFRSQLAQNTQSMIEARNSLGQAYHQINQLLNKPITEQVDVKDTLLSNILNDDASYQYLLQALDDPKQQIVLTQFFIDEAKRNAPEIKNLGYNIEVTKRNYRLNDKGRYIPTVALQGQYNHTFSKSGVGTSVPTGYPVMPDGSYNVGLNLSLPLFQQNTRNINRQTALIQEDQLSLQREDLELNIERNINDMVLDLINEMTNIEISKVDLAFSKESLELSQNEYQNGAIPVIQLIDAQSNYFKAQLANSTAQYNFRIALMKLQRMLGNFFDMNTASENEDFMLRAKQYILSKN